MVGHTSGGLRVSIEGMSKGLFGFVPRSVFNIEKIIFLDKLIYMCVCAS